MNEIERFEESMRLTPRMLKIGIAIVAAVVVACCFAPPELFGSWYP